MRTACATFLYTLFLGIGGVAGTLCAQQGVEARWAESAAQLRQLSGRFATALALDVDLDGRRDLVLGGADQLVMGQAGSLLFQARSGALPVDSRPVRGMISLDVDADGDPDLLQWFDPRPRQASLRLLRNDRSRGFHLWPMAGLKGIGVAIQAAAAGDLDGDGDVDLVLATAQGLQLLHNQAALGLVPQVSSDLPHGGQVLADDLLLADLDQDRDLDLFLARRRPEFGKNVIYENRGGGRFVDVTAQRVRGLPGTAQRLILADFDGSGRPDLLVFADWGAVLARQNPQGLFVTQNIQVPLVVQAAQLTTLDYDRDGDPDLLLVRDVSPYGNQLLRNDGGGKFTDVSKQTPGLPEHGGRAVLASDLDGDGLADLTYLGVQGRVRILRGVKRGGFVAVTGRTFDLRLPRSSLAELHDVDGDGDLDLLTDRGLFLSDGMDRWKPSSTLSRELAGAVQIEVFDADGDGDADLCVGHEGFSIGKHPAGAQNLLLLNDGQGGFVNVTRSHLPQRMDTTLHLRSVDLDGDGDADLVVTNGYLPTASYPVGVSLLFNDGQGRFADHSHLLPYHPKDPQQVQAGDFDGRYGVDLVVVDREGLHFFMARAQGGYTPVVKGLKGLPGDLRAAALFDADGDRDLDLVVGGTKGLRYYHNDGRAGLSPAAAVFFPSWTHPVEHLRAVDLDRDGHRDLLVASPAVGLGLLGNYGGVFLERSSWIQGQGAALRTAVGDLDLDGDLDVCVVGGDRGLRFLLDLQQQLHLAHPARLGGLCVLDLHYRNSAPVRASSAMLVVGLQPARVPLPGLGVLGLAPAVFLPTRAMPGAAGRLEFRFDVPASVQLGTGVFAQALIWRAGGTRLSNTARVWAR